MVITVDVKNLVCMGPSGTEAFLTEKYGAKIMENIPYLFDLGFITVLTKTRHYTYRESDEFGLVSDIIYFSYPFYSSHTFYIQTP